MARHRIKYYSPGEVKQQGKKDGRSWKWKFMPPSWPFWETKDPDPPVNQKEHSQYEAKLISVAHENLERIGNEWSKEDEKLTAEYCNAKNKKEDLESQIEEDSEEHKDAIIQYEKAKITFFNFPPRWAPLTVYWLIFGFVAIGEGFFNYYVFQIFGQEEFETFLMAGAIIVTLLVASELLGHHLKKETKSSMDKFMIGLMTIFAFAALSAFAIVRETFFEASQSAGAFNIPISPIVLAGIFITLNFAFFVGLTYLSYTEARKKPGDYRKAKKEYEEGLKAVKEKGRTSILGSLQVAERVFKNAKRDKAVLVIMSDMLEDSSEYNFEKEDLSQKRTDEIIARQKQRGRMPDLSGVNVYAAGARASAREQFYNIQNFWLRYFKECGANLSKERYGSAFLNFNE